MIRVSVCIPHDAGAFERRLRILRRNPKVLHLTTGPDAETAEAAGEGRAVSSRGSHALVALVLFAFHLVTYLSSTNTTTFDSRWVILTATSLVTSGNLDLDEYRGELERKSYWGTIEAGGHRYDYFPVVPALLAAPFVETARAWGADPAAQPMRQQLERFTAAVIAALCCAVFFWLLAGEQPLAAAVVWTVLFGLGSSMWSIASRALWQHGPSILLVSTAFALLARGNRTRRASALVGAITALAYVARPTNAIAIAVFGLFHLVRRREALSAYLAGAAIPLLAFAALNTGLYGSMLPPYFSVARLGGDARLGEALLGNLLSPGRGLFVFSPILILVVAGTRARLSAVGTERDLAATSIAISLLHLVSISLYYHWWGGHSFGPRLMSDVLPFLFYLAAGTTAHLERLSKPAIVPVAVLACILGAASIGIHYRGANAWSSWSWNKHPANVDEHPERLWDWGDIQFLRQPGKRHGSP